jgi:hypothetical protein
LECIPRACQLPFANRVHDFNAHNRTPRRPERLEAEHRTRNPFHGSMILFHNIIEIFRMADNDGRLMSLVVVRNRRRVGPTLIDSDFLRQSLCANGFV